MKFISLGLHCSVPEALHITNLRNKSYPFDWILSPSKTTYEIIRLLLKEGINKAVYYMTSNYQYYNSIKKEEYVITDEITEYQINKETGLGITFFKIDDDYKMVLKIRLERLLNDILSSDKLVFIYADCPSKKFNYTIDNKELGLDATIDLEKIYDLIHEYHSNIEIVYYCWKEREKQNKKIKHISFEDKHNWYEVSRLIAQYLIKTYGSTCIY
jgi:hypothetical protein